MVHVWSWGGEYIGYIDGQSLWSHRGSHLANLSGDELYNSKGQYAGELRNENRIIFDRNKKRKTGGEFIRTEQRIRIIPHVNYGKKTMILGYDDFLFKEKH